MNIITDTAYLSENDEFDCCQFENLNLANASLRDKEFSSVVFVACNLSNCDISESTFKDCQFVNCRLSNAEFANTKLQDITFVDCELIGINWTTLEWEEKFASKRKKAPKKRRSFSVSFQNCVLNYSIFIGMDLYSASFIDSVLKELSFEDSDLGSANFKGTDLTNSIFKNTDLQKADFSSARNYTISAYTNQIKGAQFSFPEVMSLIHTLEIEIV